MPVERSVLVVSPKAQLTSALDSAIRRAGCRPLVARSFEAARGELHQLPDLLVTELKLGEYNGLQLALRCRTRGMPAIVIADSAYEHEIERLGAVWISPEQALSDDLPTLVAQLMQSVPSAEPLAAWCADGGNREEVSLLEMPAAPLLH